MNSLLVLFYRSLGLDQCFSSRCFGYIGAVRICSSDLVKIWLGLVVILGLE